MVGWRDSDGDGKEKYDPVDTTPKVTLTPFSPDPTSNNTPTYTGSANDVPFPSPTETPVTINTIASVEYRVDGGSWQPATPSDGAFNSDTETFKFTPPALANGVHLFEVRATNSIGNVSSIAQDTLTIAASAPPAATLSSPSGASATATPTYTWTAVAAATYYYLWVNNGSGTPVLQQWYTATQAGCGSGAGSCSITPTGALATGSYTWWIQTWNPAGYGAWSSSLGFTVSTP
jgi:hypothetical protein